MGYYYKTCGYNSAKDFFNALSKNEDNHLFAFILFIEKNNIIPWMRQKNWRKIAYLYNGPEYAKNNYHIKLEKAYNKYK